jgi:hypothetical protein
MFVESYGFAIKQSQYIKNIHQRPEQANNIVILHLSKYKITIQTLKPIWPNF